jgi:hypothetical protein
VSIHPKGINALKYLHRMHPAGLEPATCNLEGCCSIPTELRMLTIGLEPILPKGTDFKSVVFTNFTKRAKLGNQSPCFEISTIFLRTLEISKKILKNSVDFVRLGEEVYDSTTLLA